jgi:hypothetical protein
MRGAAHRALHVDERYALLEVKMRTPFDGLLCAAENRNDKALDSRQKGNVRDRNCYVPRRVDKPCVESALLQMGLITSVTYYFVQREGWLLRGSFDAAIC